jgi:hypothetical protein
MVVINTYNKYILRITTSGSGFSVSPIIVLASRALGSTIPELLESFDRVESFWILLELGSSQGFDFL